MSCWIPGVIAEAKIDPVALAVKSTAPFSLAMAAEAPSVWDSSEPAGTAGRGRADGPPGLDPPTFTANGRALGSVWAQLRKNAAVSGFLALAEMPNVLGADIATCLPPAVSDGKRKNPTSSFIDLARLADSQSPLNMNNPLPLANWPIIAV